MKNFKLIIQYDGTKYKGWQRLSDNDDTIQGKIENVLSRLTNEKIELIGSGRTDAGTHAENQIANFKTVSNLSSFEILDYCYEYLPHDIVVKTVEEVDTNFHSRYNAKSKIYLYKICNKKRHDVFTRKYSYHVKDKLDINKMKEAAEFFIGEHDFKSFTSLKSKKKSTIRKIYSIKFEVIDDNINIFFHGNGFLYNMVRIIVGTLLEVGLGKIPPQDIKKIMEAKDRSLAGPTVPAQGLFLMEVKY